MADIFIDKTSALLAKTLDGSALRHTVLADNIANVDTPDYTRKDLSFEDQLREVVSQSDADPDQVQAEVASLSLSVAEDFNAPRRADGNNVNIEREMTEVAKNSLQYDTAAQILSMKFRALKLAIREGRA